MRTVAFGAGIHSTIVGGGPTGDLSLCLFNVEARRSKWVVIFRFKANKFRTYEFPTKGGLKDEAQSII